MNSYRYPQKPRLMTFGSKVQRQLLFVLVIILALALVFTSILYVRASVFQSKANQQFERRVNSSLIDAIDQVNRLTGGVQSNSSMKLALVRQYIFNIDQINDISMAISGERGRIVPPEAIAGLYNDLDTYERLIQTATSTTLEIRTTLLTHLTALQEIIRQQ